MGIIKSWFIDADNKTGCRFLVVDAYNESIPLKYYERNGFNYLFSSSEQEMEYFGYEPKEILRTRLMYFDLIRLKV